jgi:hypothetical protein
VGTPSGNHRKGTAPDYGDLRTGKDAYPVAHLAEPQHLGKPVQVDRLTYSVADSVQLATDSRVNLRLLVAHGVAAGGFVAVPHAGKVWPRPSRPRQRDKLEGTGH